MTNEVDMNDADILGQIRALVDREHSLRAGLERGEVAPAEEQTALQAVEQQLDAVLGSAQAASGAAGGGRRPGRGGAEARMAGGELPAVGVRPGACVTGGIAGSRPARVVGLIPMPTVAAGVLRADEALTVGAPSMAHQSCVR